MARTIKHEQRLLSADELTLVEKSHHPALGLLPDHDLKELRKLLRGRRDKAQDIAARQRRELRGKAAPKSARPATGDSGTREKRDLLAAALQRLNKETTRREAKAARQELIDNARRALELRMDAPNPFGLRRGARGMREFTPKTRRHIRCAMRPSSARSANTTKICRPSVIRNRCSGAAGIWTRAV